MSGGIVQVSIGLGDVGGSAHLGRLVARTLVAYAEEKALPFEVLDLGRDDPRLPGIARTGFHGRQIGGRSHTGGHVRMQLNRQTDLLHQRPDQFAGGGHVGGFARLEQRHVLHGLTPPASRSRCADRPACR